MMRFYKCWKFGSNNCFVCFRFPRMFCFCVSLCVCRSAYVHACMDLCAREFVENNLQTVDRVKTSAIYFLLYFSQIFVYF